MNAFIGIGIGLVINLAVKAIDNFAHRTERVIEAANELSSSYKKAFDDISSGISNVSGLEEEFNELSKGVDDFGNNISLDTSSYERYRSIVQELVEINPSLISGYDAEGDAIINKNKAIEETIELLKEERKQKAYDAVYGKDEKGNSNFSIAYKGEKAKYLEEKNSIEGQTIDLALDLFSGIDLNDTDLVEQMKAIIGESIGDTDLSTTLTEYMNRNSVSIAENYADIIAKLGDAGLVTNDKLKVLSKAYQNYVSSTDNATKVSKEFLQELNMIAASEDKYDLLSQSGRNVLTNLINGLGRDTLIDNSSEDEIIQFVTDITEAIADATPAVQEAFNSLLNTEHLNESLSAKDYISEIEAAVNTVQSYFKGKGINIDVISTFNLDDASITDVEAMLGQIKDKLSISAKFEGDTDAIDDFMSKIKELPVGDLIVVVNSMIDEVGNMTIDEFLEKLERIKSEMAEQQTFSKMSASVADLEKQLKSASTAESDYAKIVDVVNDKHTLTDKEVIELCSRYSGLQDSLTMTSEGWKLESSAMDVVNSSLTGLQSAYIVAQQTMSEVLSSGISSRLQALNIELEGIKSLSDAYAAIGGGTSATYQKAVKNKNIHSWDADPSTYYDYQINGKTLSQSDRASILKWGYAQDTINRSMSRIKSLSGMVGAGSVGGGKSSGGGGSKTEVERYTAEIDKLYNLTVKMTEAQEDLTDIQRKMEDLDDSDYATRIAYIDQEIAKTEEINDLLHQQNELRDSIINQNVKELRDKGFKVDYNDSINYLEIQNMEHLNELKGKSQEETNELIKKYEELINTTIELNSANKDNSASWQDNASAVRGYTKEIAKLNEEMFDSYMSKWDNFFSINNDFNLFGPSEEIEHKKELLQDIVEWYEKGLISADKFNESYNSVAKDIYDTQLDSLEEILDMVEDMIRQEKEDMVDALEKQKDNYRDLIDLKKQSLRLTEKELSYNREIDEKTRAIAKLQARIDQLSLDDSRAAQAERAALLEELAKLQAELADYQNDHGLELQEDALDKEYDNFEDNIDKEIDAVQAGLDNAANMHQQIIEYINEHWDTLYEELVDWNSVYGTGVEADVKGAWDNALTSLEAYRAELGRITTEQAALTGIDIKRPETPNYETTSAQDIVGKMYQNSLSAGARFNSIKSGNANADSKLWQQDSVLQQLGQSNISLGEQLAKLLGKFVKRASSGVWFIDGEDLFKKFGYYHRGGIVGRRAGDVKRNELFSLLEEGEVVLTTQQQQQAVNLIKSGGIQPKSYLDFLSKADIIRRGQGIFSGMQSAAQQPNITIQVENRIEGGNIMDDKKLIRKIGNETCNSIMKGLRKSGVMGTSFPIRPS